MKILITGGAGFIGSHIVEKCVEDGHSVIVLDDLSTGKLENVCSGAKFIEGDIASKEVFDNLSLDVIFHLAARTSVQESIEELLIYNKNNVEGMLNVLEFAKRCGAIVVLSSSSSIYGDAEIKPTPEETKLDPMSPYALQKLICEQYCDLYFKLFGVKSVALRYFNVWGPRPPEKGYYVNVIGIFERQLKRGEPFTIVGTGEQRRDFIHVSDVVEANLKAVEFARTSEKFEVFNIGTGKNYSVNEVADSLSKNNGRVYLPPRIEPFENLANIEKAKRLLSWKPKNEYFL